jgi:hypothetical protein
MTTYARIVDGCAVDVTAGDLGELFHADVAAQFQTVPDGTENGDLLNADGSWTKHVATPAASVTPSLAPLTPMTFYLAFKSTERIAIKKSTDPLVMEFWEAYQLAVQLGKDVDPNLPSVADSVAYLAQGPSDTPPGAGILASKDRVAQILAGVPQ